MNKHRGRRPDRRIRAGAHLIWAALLLLAVPAAAQQPVIEEKPFAEHFLLLQLSDGEPGKQQQVLSVAGNLLEHYGPDLIDIEVVTFGPGIRLLYAASEHAETVEALASQGVRFVVCMNTVDTIERTQGEVPELNDVAVPVQVGVAHMLDRVADGYTLVRP